MLQPHVVEYLPIRSAILSERNEECGGKSHGLVSPWWVLVHCNTGKAKSVRVKHKFWSNYTANKTYTDNLVRAGHYLNFDLAWPSSSIPSDFFPSDPSLYGESESCLHLPGIADAHAQLSDTGYTVSTSFPVISESPVLTKAQDFGVWNISYESVDCESAWAGSSNISDFGAATNLGPESVCCPSDPFVRTTIPCRTLCQKHCAACNTNLAFLFHAGEPEYHLCFVF